MPAEPARARRPRHDGVEGNTNSVVVAQPALDAADRRVRDARVDAVGQRLQRRRRPDRRRRRGRDRGGDAAAGGPRPRLSPAPATASASHWSCRRQDLGPTGPCPRVRRVQHEHTAGANPWRDRWPSRTVRRWSERASIRISRPPSPRAGVSTGSGSPLSRRPSASGPSRLALALLAILLDVARPRAAARRVPRPDRLPVAADRRRLLPGRAEGHRRPLPARGRTASR